MGSSATAEPIYDLSRLSFLVVDDNQHMVSIIREILRAFGVQQVYDARDAADGFELFRHSPVDIIIVDYLMEPLDGLDFIRLIRTAADSPNREVPIILLTAYTERSRVMAGRDAGATEILSKPVSARKLYARILSIIDQPRTFIKSPRYTGPDRRRNRSSGYTGPERRKTNLQIDD